MVQTQSGAAPILHTSRQDEAHSINEYVKDYNWVYNQKRNLGDPHDTDFKKNG